MTSNTVAAKMGTIHLKSHIGTAFLTGRLELAVPLPHAKQTQACPFLLTMLALHLGLVCLGIVFIAGVLQAACKGGHIGLHASLVPVAPAHARSPTCAHDVPHLHNDA